MRALFSGFFSTERSEEEIEAMFNRVNTVFDFTGKKLVFSCPIPKEMFDEGHQIPELTMMAWVKPLKYGDIRVFDSSVAGENFGGFGFDLYCQYIRFLGSHNNNAYVGVNCQSSTSKISTHDWNHCCVTFKNGLLRFYLNGVLDREVLSDIIKLDPPVEDKLCIGYSMRGDPGSFNYDGFMSQLSLWNIELTSDEVHYCMQNNLLHLKGSSNISSLKTKLENNALLYLPYVDLEDSTHVRNFGCDNFLKIRVNNTRTHHSSSSSSSTSQSISTDRDNADFLVKDATNMSVLPVCKRMCWNQSLHKFYPKENRDLVVLLLMIGDKHANLPSELIQVILSFIM